MPFLADIYSAADAFKRNLKDIVQNPRAVADRQILALRNTTRGQEPVINDQGAGMREIPREEQYRRAVEGSLDSISGGLGVIKPKGGNWLSGQVEEVVSRLRRNPENIRVAAGPGGVARTQAARANAEALNQWLEGPMTKYLKRDFATPGDPIRKLAEQGILHYTPNPELIGAQKILANRRRKQAGTESMAQTPLGQVWENVADLSVSTRPAENFLFPYNLKKDPWLANVDPKTPVNSLYGEILTGAGEFKHLTDELVNSLREGRLRPEQLTSGNLSVEGAVRHVAEVNALRAKQAEAAAQAEMAGIPLHKDYPEQGMSWRQLKSDDEAQLQKWLTQEGDAMGHCVGGYCPDVSSGRSSIYSLRDAKGQPHVTIETQPGNDWKYDLFEASRQGNAIDVMFGERASEIRKAFNESPFNNIQQFLEKNPEYLPQKQNIVQIKGKGNAKPADQYLPFVQDFLRSGKWSAIQDAHNTGLTPQQIDEILKGNQ